MKTVNIDYSAPFYSKLVLSESTTGGRLGDHFRVWLRPSGSYLTKSKSVWLDTLWLVKENGRAVLPANWEFM